MRQIMKTIWILGMILLLLNCNSKGNKTENRLITSKIGIEVIDTGKNNMKSGDIKTRERRKKYKVTFIELGSVRCIPCRMMQPIMKSIGEKYGDHVKVVFYDIWTPEESRFADQYAIKVIPTQVFLDKKGKEFFRHEGYFPEEELVKVLQSKGVK
jgi:thioredoxin 1